jgi:sulfatase modifying factor 1
MQCQAVARGRGVVFACMAALALCAAPPLWAQTLPGKKVALLVGVNQYDKRGFRDLEFAERDVEEMAALLDRAGYEVHLLTGRASGAKRATLKNIRAALEAMLKDRTKRDLVLVALAGHGLQIEVAGPDGKLQADSFFCPADAEQGNPKTMLSMGSMFEEINRRGGGRNLVLVDACREDPTRGRGMDGSTVKTLPEGVAVLFGCRAAQKTFETRDAGGGHGVFFHFVLEGLRGNAKNARGEVTWARLTEYVLEQVESETPRLMKSADIVQTPNLIANLPGISPVLVKGGGPPAMLVAPFDERAAKARQREWAQYFGKAETIETNRLDMKLVLIPPGELLVGSSEAESERVLREYPSTKREEIDDEKQHKVRITKPFYLGMYEVTKGQFQEFVRAKGYKTEAQRDGLGGFGYDPEEGSKQKPSYSWQATGFAQSDNHPVVNVTWNDAEAFCRWLSETDREGRTYRLPTEAEWEYACRAGTETRYYFGVDDAGLTRAGNVADQTAKETFDDWKVVAGRDGYVFTAPVGQFRTNAFGLYDMHGNVWEWCADWYRKDYEALPSDNPFNEDRTSKRVHRGGSWVSFARDCRCAFRSSGEPTDRNDDLGFRVLAVAPNK